MSFECKHNIPLYNDCRLCQQEQAESELATLRAQLASQREDNAALIDAIRVAMGQIVRIRYNDAMGTLENAAGHYLSCAWWGRERVCDCGGIQ